MIGKLGFKEIAGTYKGPADLARLYSHSPISSPILRDHICLLTLALFPLPRPRISGEPSPRWHQLAAKPRGSNNSVCTRIYRTPDTSLPGALTARSKDRQASSSTRLYLQRGHRSVLPSSPAFQFPSLALQAFLSQLTIARLKGRKSCKVSAGER